MKPVVIGGLVGPRPKTVIPICSPGDTGVDARICPPLGMWKPRARFGPTAPLKGSTGAYCVRVMGTGGVALPRVRITLSVPSGASTGISIVSAVALALIEILNAVL